MGVGHTWYHSVQTSFQRRFRNGLSFAAHYTLGRATGLAGTMRTEVGPDGTPVLRADNTEANDHLQGGDRTHTVRGNFVWDMPDPATGGPVRNLVSLVLRDWQLSGVLTAGSGAVYTPGFSYQGGIGAVNLTGTPTHNARIAVNGDPGNGCSSDLTRQFDTSAFSGPQPNSLGLESGLNYMRGCADKTIDLALARNIRFGGSRSIQFRVEAFNVFNTVVITGRNASMQMASLATADTAINLPYDANGNLIGNRDRPQGAGFGVATAAAPLRTVQAQIRFQF
jgi:hypothetical protein